MVIAIPLVLILLEFLATILVGVAGKSAELTAYEGEPAIVTAYNLKFLDSQKQPYDGLSNRGQLAAQRSIAVGYSLVGKQQSDFWRINEQGFRDDQPVPLAKPKNEFRIFLLGGSTAFGQGNESNQATIASKLEARLNQRVVQQRKSPQKYRPTILPFYKPDLVKALAKPPRLRDGKYRVINAAVPGYTSGNELAQLALKIMPYRPDAILILDGYADLMLPSNQSETNIPKTEAFLSSAPGHFWIYLTRKLNNLVADTTVVKATQKWLLKPEPSVSQQSLVMADETAPLEQHLAAEASELEKRTTRYRDYHRQIIRLTTGARIPLVIALQPEITGRGTKQISAQEQEILKKLGSTYKQKIPENYVKLAQVTEQLQQWFPKNVKVLNFYKLYQEFPNQAFFDAVHLTEVANLEISERFYYALSELPKLQVPFQQR
ncbi:MAG: SGNH/GDSL hydrolase family protein [Symploca sp. SIO2E9]|nr:SGNH/GDSL hydrolase family protein [Symploca sp. SIO2E9]